MFRNLKEFSLPAVEEKVLAYWRANNVFEASLALRGTQGKRARKRFMFYEGPPTANGRPGIHHVLARAFKDIIPRYKTMRGFYVPRRGGWDTHGLPVEIEVEKALGLKSKKEIEKFGIAAFNAKCRESVWKYKDEWEKLTKRMGFWLDMKHPYVTYENRYMEAVWGILKEVWKKKLLYRGHKVVPWCPRCGTGLSSHELALGYETVEDTSVYVKFKLKTNNSKLKTSGDTYILSWTTTPWTLPGNVALAVGKDIRYVIVESRHRASAEDWVESDGEILQRTLTTPGTFIFCPDVPGIGKIFDDLVDHRQFAEYVAGKRKLEDVEGVLKVVKGKDLVGLEYEPLFDVPALKSKTSYKVYHANFVTTTDGTGVVHTAVMYGEDDYQLGMKVWLPARHTVDEAGKFTADVKGFGGLYVKSSETEKKIIDYLKTKNYLLKTEPYSHEYPFCWRCRTPLLYYARDSWFIAMSKLRAKLLSENKKINWVPAHLRDGRFGEWLREVKDWAISRSRYWGTPLPIWQCDKCEHVVVLGSIAELARYAGNAHNRYIFLRHGQSENNVTNIINNSPSQLGKFGLTLIGQRQAEQAGKQLRSKHIDRIVASDFRRTKETAEIVARVAGITRKIEFDERIREENVGDFNGRPAKEFHEWTHSVPMSEWLGAVPPGGESKRDIFRRVFQFLSEMEKKHHGETILVVAHETIAWAFETVSNGWSEGEAIAVKIKRKENYFGNGEWREAPLLTLPRNENGIGDLHRPYVDDVVFGCTKCKGTMKRIPEVLDVWFDSGAMPFAQNTNRHEFSTNRHEYGIDYPADYISEGVDQTRGWFYTLHAIGILMGKGRAYKNVISLGLILDKNGQKMSKSKGNTVDPWALIEKYGIDAVRWYLYTVNPAGEPKKFDEADIGKTLRQFLMMVYNSYLFYETYAEKQTISAKAPASANILDKWMLARLAETEDFATRSLEKYEVGDAARAIEAFAGDLSRWYIRRSRRRFQPARIATQSVAGGKPESDKDYRAASATLGYALLALAKLMAPFTPFFAEALYLSLVPNKKGVVESVHLENWPKVDSKLKTKNLKLLKEMGEVRKFASLGLAARADKGIKVRQPLASLKLKTNNSQLKTNKELLAILADEVNVKKVVVDAKLKEPLLLDTNITHELLEEGWFRELVRTVQGMRQDAKLAPKDIITVHCEVPPELTHVIRAREKEFMREVNAKSVEFTRVHKHNVELQTKVGEFPVWLAVKKV